MCKIWRKRAKMRGYLPGFAFPDASQMQADLALRCKARELVLIVMTVAGLATARAADSSITPAICPCSPACKGFEQDSGLLTFQVVKMCCPIIRASGVSRPAPALRKNSWRGSCRVPWCWPRKTKPGLKRWCTN